MTVSNLLSSIPEDAADWLYWGGQILLVIAAVTGAVGAFAMIVGDRARDRIGDQRMSDNELKTTTAVRDAAVANKAAAEAEQRAAEANHRAAEANQRTAVMAQRTAELEYRNIVRCITPEGRANIVSALSKYEGQPFVIQFPAGDVEALQFGADISRTLVNSGWIATNSSLPNPEFNQNNTVNVGTGVVMFTNASDSQSKKFQDAADAFCAVVPVAVRLLNDNVPRGTIMIHVPSKPHRLGQQILPSISEPEKLAPSPLNDHINNLAPEIMAYSGQGVVVICPWNDVGAESMAIEFVMAFGRAGWVVKNDFNNPNTYRANYSTNFVNVSIGISDADAASDSVRKVATALLDALKKHKIARSDAILRETKGAPAGDVYIWMGISPFKLNP
jgi:hypothetical protein